MQMTTIPASPIPASHRDIVDNPSFWHVSTIGPEGAPQSSPVWIGSDDSGNLLFSSLKGRQKYRNLVADSRVALSATDPANPYRYLEIRGTVIRIDDDPGGPFLDVMAKKYLGVDIYPSHDPETDKQRVIIVIRPERCTTMG